MESTESFLTVPPAPHLFPDMTTTNKHFKCTCKHTDAYICIVFGYLLHKWDHPICIIFATCPFSHDVLESFPQQDIQVHCILWGGGSTHTIKVTILTNFFGCTQGMWKFQEQGLNPCHSWQHWSFNLLSQKGILRKATFKHIMQNVLLWVL